MNPSYFFCGSVTVKADNENVTALLNLCMYHCIPYTDFTPTDSGILLSFRLSAWHRLKKEAEARGICFETVEKRGIPAVFQRYKHRIGFLLGFLMAAVLVFLSQRFVWDIEITGNERLTSSEIQAMLKQDGFHVGSYIPTANTDRIENRILMKTDSISWISINIIGTVAHVQVRELEHAAEKDTSVKPANLIAAKSGLVEEVRVYRGNVVTRAGAYVEKGDLLVSGLYDSERVGFRFTRASGTVMARTTAEYYIEVPYEYEGVRYTGDEYCDKSLIFFDYLINISKNSRKEGVLYDKINIVENCSFPDGTETPLEIKTEKYLAYEKVSLRRTPEEAEELAYFELSQRLSSAAEDATILRKTVIPTVKENSFVLICSVVLVEDIAEVSEFEVDLGVREQP